MTVTEAAAVLGLARGTVRGYCRAVGLQKTNGQYDIDPEIVEEWRFDPPKVASSRRAAAGARDDVLDGPPIKKHVSEWAPGIQEARKARRERLLIAIRKAGV